MAVTVDAVSQGQASGATSLTYAHTCGGSDRGLFVPVCVNDNRTITSVTYNGVSMTAVETGSVSYRLYGIIAPATGTNNVGIAVSASGNITSVSTSVNGMDQATGWNGVQVSTTISQSDQGVTVTSAADDLVLGCLILVRDTTISSLTPGADQTLRGTPQELAYSYTAMSTEPGGASVAHTYAYASTNAAFVQRIVAVNVLAASGGGAFTLTADVGSFALTGHAAALTVQRRLTAAVGTFALTGHAAGLTAQRRLVAAPGTFTLTGHAAALAAQRRLAAAVGTFTLTGHDADLRVGLSLVAEAGVFTLTGHAAALIAARRLTAETGVFTLTGHAADLRVGLTLVAETGAFTLSGHAAALLAARLLTAEAGVFTLTGQPAGLAAGRHLTAEAGAFVLTGHAAVLLAQRILAAAVGTFTLTGHDAALTYSGFVPGVPGPHPLRVSFTLMGKSVAFTALTKRAAFTPLTKSVDLEA